MHERDREKLRVIKSIVSMLLDANVSTQDNLIAVMKEVAILRSEANDRMRLTLNLAAIMMLTPDHGERLALIERSVSELESKSNAPGIALMIARLESAHDVLAAHISRLRESLEAVGDGD